MAVSEAMFRQVALEDPEGHWELHCGALRRKPAMTMEHNDVMDVLHGMLFIQLDLNEYRVRVNAGHLRLSAERYYIPDLFVVPVAMRATLRGTRELETYGDPLPLVVEVWSRSTSDYDVEVKLVEYRRRGHAEIWYFHPYERTLKTWRRQPDGSYQEAVLSGGTVQPVALPGVTIDLNALFALVG